jgi:plasmid stabilization system protein ParE
MKGVLTEQAELDLERIGDAIAHESPRRAVSFVAELKEKCGSLGATPKAFPVIGRYRRVVIRRRVHGDYLIFYRLGRHALVVLRIFHGATNYEELLSLRSVRDPNPKP